MGVDSYQMPVRSGHDPTASTWSHGLEFIPRLALAAVPLFVLRPLLQRIADGVAHNRPEVFSRLGAHASKRFLIDPTDLPFVLLLEPRPTVPRLTSYRRTALPRHDASIAGRFIDLLDMVDGRLDGDALFFSRALRVGGDTEAVVSLRNALDDVDGSVIDNVINAFGPLAPAARLALAALRAARGAN